jgi:transposase
LRKDVYEGVRFFMINDIKPNFNELGRQYNCDPRTVKKYYLEGSENSVKKDKDKPKRPSKLDPFKEIIDQKLELNCSAMAIFKFLKKIGYQGGYTIVKDYCRNKKHTEIKKATLRVETVPGTAAQVDWKEDMTLHDKFGKSYTFNLFLYVLHFSKLKFITLTWDRKQDTLFSCLYEAFNHTGGVPKEIWFDNMKTVVDRARTQYRKVVFNTRFYEFSKDAGFEAIACRSYRPQTKGSVESLAKLVERLKPYDYEFYDAVDLISLVNTLCYDLNYEEISQSTYQRPVDLWEREEKGKLHPVNEALLTPYFEDNIVRIVTNESMVNFRKSKYSVPTKYIGCEVEIEIDPTEKFIEIFYQGEVVQSHELTGKRLNYKETDMFEILKSDVMKHKDDEEIYEYIQRTLTQYDEL